MKLKINFLLILAVAALISSCEAEGYADYDPGQTNTQELSGEWWVSAYDLEGNRLSGYQLLSTYNTAANNNMIWVDDHENLLPLKVKATASVEDLAFYAESADNLYVEGADSTEFGTATITDGEIINDGARASGSNNVVDSLAFKVELSHDPDSPYIIAGYRRTGFEEDEH